MGGKGKQAQQPRMKNNAKPSSSGRSAELLGTTTVPFVGFATKSDSIMPLIFESSELNIDPKFQMVFRKMSKKDAVTKVKALQEFITLINENDEEIIKSILPAWPKYYQTLSIDSDNMVRETSQLAQKEIVLKLKKQILPILKQILPVWILSSFDEYAPVASISSSSFNNAFPSSKIQDCLLYAQSDFLESLTKNLTFHSASTLSNKSCTAEESEARYQRIVIGSLKSLGYFIENAYKSEKLDKLKIVQIIENPKYLSFVKNKNPKIKSAWFESISIILHCVPDILEKNKSQVLQICFQNMTEANQFSLPHIWNCVLSAQFSFSDWQEVINLKKDIEPKLMALLNSQYLFHGIASSICPNFLPFISKISENPSSDLQLHEFYNNFFQNIKTNIKNLQPNASKLDVSSLLAAYFECLRFVFKEFEGELSKGINRHSLLATEFLEKYVIDILKWGLNVDHFVTRYINNHLSSMIAYWSSIQTEFYQKMLQIFFSELMIIFNEKLLINNDDYIEDNLINLINSLRCSAPSIEANKVKFEVQNQQSEKKILDRCSKNSTSSPIYNNLKEIIIEVLRNKITKDFSIKSILQLKKICNLFGNKEFYLKISTDGNLQPMVYKLIELLKANEFSEELLDIIFEITDFLEKNEQSETIKTILKVEHEQIQNIVLQRILSYPLCLQNEVHCILKQTDVSRMILNIGKHFLTDNSTQKLNLLHKCFFQMENGEFLIDDQTIEGIADIMSIPLQKPEEYRQMIEPCGSFISQIFPVIYSNKNFNKDFRNKLFIILYKFCINMVENDDLSEDTLWEITTAWQDALSSNEIKIDTEGSLILLDCGHILNERISYMCKKSSEIISIDNLISIADNVAKLLLCASGDVNNTSKLHELIENKIDIFFNTLNSNQISRFQIENLCLYFEIITKSLNVTEIIPNPNNLSAELIRNFFVTEFIKFMIIYKLTCNASKNADQSEEDIIIKSQEHQDALSSHWTDNILDNYRKSIEIAAIGESLNKNSDIVQDDTEIIILELSERIKSMLSDGEENNVEKLQATLIDNAVKQNICSVRSLQYLVNTKYFSQYEENSFVILFEEVSEKMIEENSHKAYCSFMRFFLDEISSRSLVISDELLNQADISIRTSFFFSLIRNHSSNDLMNLSDKKIIEKCIKFLTEIGETQLNQKLRSISNIEIENYDNSVFNFLMEFINLLKECIERFPNELNVKNWDSIRIGLSSLVLVVSKNIENYNHPKVSIFTASVYGLFYSLTKFIRQEKIKSSTELLTNMIDEWENLFSKEINLILFKNFYQLVSIKDNNSIYYVSLLNVISPLVEAVDVNLLYNAYKNGMKISLNDVVNFVLENLQNFHSVRTTCLFIIKNISTYFIRSDMENLEKDDSDQIYLFKFSVYEEKYRKLIEPYVNEFSYKLQEISEFQVINNEDALTYFYLWDAIIDACSKAPAQMRPLYATWVSEHGFETFLNFVFRSMPIEILKNFDTTPLNNDIFKNISLEQLRAGKISRERFACYLYTNSLRYLPALVRKIWNSSHARQKLFVDKLTTNYVSNIIWQEDLQEINQHDKKHESMQITVHTSTREVVAFYSIDEARMELTITLAQNHPLGGIKVITGKQIGGRASARNQGMQLTVFLMHQNGSILDGLSLWKENLDKKFSGVEECYVCYTVIHQDTCQLPKLTCKTCKKKFHGPCLYKWFTTSSKSTCPLCRNIF